MFEEAAAIKIEWCPVPIKGERRSCEVGSRIPSLNNMEVFSVMVNEKDHSAKVYLKSKKQDGGAVLWKKMVPGNPSIEITYQIEREDIYGTKNDQK